jgi:hypothetical protein
MKQRLKAIFYSFAVQLVLLHFKKFQILLIFWLALFGAVSGNFMASFGVDSLYLSPEYLGSVNAISAGIVGMSVGIFIMSWNITTFILFCRHFRFLATTTRPFLKYCINNAVIPLLFLVFYFVNAVDFDLHKELLSVSEVMTLVGGFLMGLVLIIFLSLGYFFKQWRQPVNQGNDLPEWPPQCKSSTRCDPLQQRIPGKYFQSPSFCRSLIHLYSFCVFDAGGISA